LLQWSGAGQIPLSPLAAAIDYSDKILRFPDKDLVILKFASTQITQSPPFDEDYQYSVWQIWEQRWFNRYFVDKQQKLTKYSRLVCLLFGCS
jgi:hypothetical protein